MRSFLFFCLLISYTCSAQYTIEGYVVDDQTGDPLPFATVALKEDPTKGFFSNELGQYRIELDSLQRRRGTLSYSLLSYGTKEIYLGDDNAPRGKGKTTLNIRLESSFLELPEIIVLSDIALRGIVRRAVDRIPVNYGTEKFLLQAYNRAYAVNDSAFASLSEAYVTIEDSAYGETKEGGPRPNKAWINQLRTTGGEEGESPRLHPFFDKQQFLTAPYTWMSNPLRYGSIDRFFMRDTGNLSHLTFRRLGEYINGTDTLVRIRCDVNPATHVGNRWPGPGDMVTELLINRTDDAILEYRNWTRGKSIYSDAFYEKTEGKYYLKRASFSWDFESDFYDGIPHVYSAFFYTTKVITDPREMRKIKKGRRMAASEKLSDLHLRYRPEFWQGEERLVQLPARDNLRFQLERILAIPAEKQDSL